MATRFTVMMKVNFFTNGTEDTARERLEELVSDNEENVGLGNFIEPVDCDEWEIVDTLEGN